MYIGLDIGTSGTKASLIDENGTNISSWQESYGFCSTRNGYRELDAAVVWDAVRTCLKAAGAGREVDTITVSALGEAVIPIDREGEPLRTGITGTDARGAAQLSFLESAAGDRKLCEITGLNLSTIYSANKIMWIKEKEREVYDRAWKFVTFQDFVIYKLTGQALIDYSMASRTLLFDLEKKEWSKELLKLSGIDKDRLSRPVIAGTCAGELVPAAARELGLGKHVKVVVGTHDHICNTIGCGALHRGDCANTMGTTEGLTALFERPQLASDSILKYQISCEPFVLPSMYNTVAWNNTSGVLLRWFAQEFAGAADGGQLMDTYKRLGEAMDERPTSLLVLPHFSGAATPYMDKDSKGAIVGLTLGTGAADIYKALMEGINFELALILDCLKKAGLTVSRLTATGGALSKELLQIKADVLGMEVHTVKNKQTGTLGGAILGAVAAGEYADIFEAAEAMVKPGESYEPDAERSRFYEEKLPFYKELYESLKKINRNI